MNNPLKVVVAGDVDAGKSTLIGRFLYESGTLPKGTVEELYRAGHSLSSDSGLEFAYLLDSFEEERREQRTIDTTQVFCTAQKGAAFVFVDVPGHKELLHNMLCGSSLAQRALLVVDREKSVQAQTAQHAFLLKFFGIKDIIVLVNKMDTAAFRQDAFEQIQQAVQEAFSRIALLPAYVIPVSARYGDNLRVRSTHMKWYKGPVLLKALQSFRKAAATEGFRFPVQAVYEIAGEKVAVGAIASGTVGRGTSVQVLPGSHARTVEAIRVFGRDPSAARSPHSIGLVLDNMEPVARGTVICGAPLPRVSTQIHARLYALAPVHLHERYVLQCATAQTGAQVHTVHEVRDTVFFERKTHHGYLEEAVCAEATVRTEHPIVTQPYQQLAALGRFILRNKKKELCAIGMIGG